MLACCSSSNSTGVSAIELEWNRKIEEQLISSAERYRPIIKLLLLGTGASGKSTFFKQIKKLYGHGFNSIQINNYKNDVKKNCVQGMRILLKHIPKYWVKIEQQGLEGEINKFNIQKLSVEFQIDLEKQLNLAKNKQSNSAIETNNISIDLDSKSDELDDEEDNIGFGSKKPLRANHHHDNDEDEDIVIDLTPQLGLVISELWKSPLIQLIYSFADEFQLNDSCPYFFNNIDRISSPAYIPTEDDILRCRAPTTGIVEQSFRVANRDFVMFDVGGQRNERKKWIHCFENVTAVLFICGISEYNQTLYEDSNTNRLTESLSLFSEIANNPFLSKTNLILFLNKTDLFQEKLALHPLSQSFPQYTGPNEVAPAIEWIKLQFQSKIKPDPDNNTNRNLYIHTTCATDSTNIDNVFQTVKDIIIKQHAP